MLAVILSSCAASMPILVTDNTSGGKEGTAEYSTFLGISPLNADASIATAAKNGGITKITSVDFLVEGGLFKTTYKTIVTGQ